jgi:hypothetical protein
LASISFNSSRFHGPDQKAVQELFRRWPFVPSRELHRIRTALLQCLDSGHRGKEQHLSEPARELLHLVTEELGRRRATGQRDMHDGGRGSPGDSHHFTKTQGGAG